jgi:hypothetical protein
MTEEVEKRARLQGLLRRSLPFVLAISTSHFEHYLERD